MTPVVVVLSAVVVLAESDPARFEAEIRKIEAAAEDGRRAGGVIFLGSSSIKLWDLERSFPGRGFRNHGFGGSTIADCIYYRDRVVTPFRPDTIVFYAGDNDIAAGRSPARVTADFQTLVVLLRRAVPGVRILYLSIKPSRARWRLWPQMREANRRIREVCADDPRLEFVDVAAPFLASGSPPEAGLFREDGLHLSDAGYDVWARTLESYLR